MKVSSGVPAADGEMLKKCATIGIPHTPDNVVTTAKCEAKLIAQPQFAIWERARRLASRTPLNVLLECAAGSGFSTTEAKARFATPMQAMKTKQARHANPPHAEPSRGG